MGAPGQPGYEHERALQAIYWALQRLRALGIPTELTDELSGVYGRLLADYRPATLPEPFPMAEKPPARTHGGLRRVAG